MKQIVFWFEAILYMTGLFCLITMGVLAFLLWLDKPEPVQVSQSVPYVCGKVGPLTIWC